MQRSLAVLAALLLALTACGGDDTAATSTSAPTTSTTSTTVTTVPPVTTTLAPVGPVWPLTGEEVADGTEGAKVLVAKIDNTSNSRPQLGLDAADVVIEVLVEGGIPRLLAFFQSDIPDELGPIRSAREVDPKLLQPFGALFAHSGGQSHVVSAVREVAADVGHPNFGNVAYYRAPDRPSLYDLILRTDDVLDEDAPPAPLGHWFTFGPAPEGGEQALSVELQQSTLNIVNYRYSASDDGYLRFNGEDPHVAVGSGQLVVDNVVVLYVEVIDTGRTDSSGSKVPDYEVFGTGDAVVFRDGKAYEAVWERSDPRSFFMLRGPAGAEIALGVGTTWIELVPVGRPLTWQ